MATKFVVIAESDAVHGAGIDYDYEHRSAEHEHESGTNETPEPGDATKRRPGRFLVESRPNLRRLLIPVVLDEDE